MTRQQKIAEIKRRLVWREMRAEINHIRNPKRSKRKQLVPTVLQDLRTLADLI